MVKTCDICGGKVGLFQAFRCQDGVVCKKCYQIASGNYATTITKMTLAEVKKSYIKNAQPLDMGEGGFQITRKIGGSLLLDEKNRKFCILSNQRLTGQSTRPVVFSYAALQSVQLISEPRLSAEQLSALAAERGGKAVIQRLAVRLCLKGVGIREITILPSPVRASGFAFRQGYKIAEEILNCLTKI